MKHETQPVIVHLVHSLQGGGTERTLVSLLRSFDPDSFRHIVVTHREAGSLSSQLPGHVACRPLDACGTSRGTCLSLARLLRGWKTRVIHARNTGCWADAILAGAVTRGVRVVLGFHGLETRAPLSGRQRRIVRWGLRGGAGFTSVSMAGKRQLCEQAGVAPDRVEVLPNGIDLTRFTKLDNASRESVRHALGIEPDAFLVGTVGSLTPVKRHDLLLHALARVSKTLKNIRLVVVGDGPLQGTLREQALAEGISEIVTLAGTRADVPELLGAMDLYVCSSESEGMNNALLEAMAAGLPIVATDVGDNASMVREGVEGRIVQPGSAVALSDAVIQLVESPAMLSRLAAAARLRANRYDLQTTVSLYEQYYLALVADRVGAGSCPAWPRACHPVA